MRDESGRVKLAFSGLQRCATAQEDGLAAYAASSRGELVKGKS